MDGTDARPERPADDRVPAFDELVHRPMPDPVAAFYAAVGTNIETISLIQITWRPGKQLTVRYRVEGVGGGLAGERDVVATSGRIPDGATIVEGPEGRVGLWVVPDDPLLPGLKSALDGPTVRGLLADLGSTEELFGARLRSYRPGRRAVVEVDAGAASIFLKVVPPSEVDALHEKHRFLSDFVAVPDSLGLAPDMGIVVMRALPGLDLRSSLRAGAKAVPDAGTIARMVEELPPPRDEWTSRSPIAVLARLADLLTRLLPEESDRLTSMVDEIGTEDAGDLTPVHGDFHEAQILTERDRATGLIDVDTYGWGHPGDDAATMMGHLHLLASSCQDPSQTLGLARSLNRYWDARLDPIDLRLRTAAVVLGLATGPFRVNRPNWRAETVARIDVAELWVESALRVDEKSLIASSGRSHPGLAS